jgi:hypothetical protein
MPLTRSYRVAKPIKVDGFPQRSIGAAGIHHHHLCRLTHSLPRHDGVLPSQRVCDERRRRLWTNCLVRATTREIVATTGHNSSHTQNGWARSLKPHHSARPPPALLVLSQESTGQK